MALTWNSGYWETTPAYWQYLHPGSTGIAVRASASASGTLRYRMTSSDKWAWVEEDGTATVSSHIWIYHNGGDNWNWWGWSATYSSGYTYFTKVQDASSTWVDGWWSGSTDIDYYWPTSGSSSAYSLWTWSTIYEPGHTTKAAKATTHSITSASGSFTCTVKNRGSTVTSQTGSYTTTKSWSFKGWRSQGSATAPSYTASSTHSASTWYNISAYTWMYAVFNSPTTSTSYSNNSITFSTPASWTDTSSSYTVTLNNNGTTSTLSSTITKTYKFSKWTNSAGSTVTSPYTFTATDTVTSNFSLNSTVAAAVTLPTPTRTNYIFQGWSTSSTATTGSYAGGSSYTPSANTTLYAIWKLNNFTVTLSNNQSWTGNYAPTGGGSYAPGASVTINQPIQTNWKFVNWTDSAGTIISTSASYTFTMPSANISYTSNVARKTYTVYYNANGGVGNVSSSSHQCGVAKALTKNNFTRLGYTFMGWSTSATATSATYTDQQSVTNLSTVDGAVVTLYAVWEPFTNMYICTSKVNGTLEWHKALKYIYTSKEYPDAVVAETTTVAGEIKAG